MRTSFRIYREILAGHLLSPTNKFHQAVQSLCSSFVQATVQLHLRCCSVFVPTANKFHYVFNMRDLTNVFMAVLFCSNDSVKTPKDMTRLWAHETQRAYRDKLAVSRDVETFDKAQVDILRKHFEDVDDGQVISPLVFCHFAKGIGECKYAQIDKWRDLGKMLCVMCQCVMVSCVWVQYI